MSDDYYLTLPSNSNLELFPENYLNSFTVQLHHILNVDETYEAGLVELHLPNNFETTVETNPDDSFELDFPGRNLTIPLISKIYDSQIHLYEEINHIIDSVKHVDDYKELTTTYRLPNISYEDNQIAIKNNHEVGLKFSSTLDQKLHYRDLDYIYVYSSLIKACFVGSTIAPLLRIVNIGLGGTGSTLSYKFDNTLYYKVSVREPSSIQVELRSATGELIAFRDKGSVIAVVHIRKIRE